MAWQGVAEAQSAMAVIEYQLGRRGPSNRHAAQACEIAVGLDAPATVGRVHSDAGMLALVGSDLNRAHECGERALAAGTEGGLDEFVIAGQMLIEGVDCYRGVPGARARVVERVEEAREGGFDELAWRGYIITVTTDMEHGELRSAQRSIEETIAHTLDRDLPTARLWHVALRSTNHARMGRWSAAREDSQEVVTSGALDGSIWQHLGLALVALRVGDEDAGPHLNVAGRWRSPSTNRCATCRC